MNHLWELTYNADKEDLSEDRHNYLDNGISEHWLDRKMTKEWEHT